MAKAYFCFLLPGPIDASLGANLRLVGGAMDLVLKQAEALSEAWVA
jgi:hypothetical protein